MYYKLQDHEKRKISGSITTWHTPFLTMSTIRSAMTEGSCAISGQKAKNRTASQTAVSGSKAVKTGDTASMAGYLLAAGAALAATGTEVVRRKRTR